MSTKQEQILKINPPVELTFTGKGPNTCKESDH